MVHAADQFEAKKYTISPVCFLVCLIFRQSNSREELIASKHLTKMFLQQRIVTADAIRQTINAMLPLNFRVFFFGISPQFQS